MILDEDDCCRRALVHVIRDQAGYYPVSAAQWISLEIEDHLHHAEALVSQSVASLTTMREVREH
jgi:hypothetical protein